MKRYFMLVLLTLFVNISYAMTFMVADGAPVQMTVIKHTTSKNNYEFERSLEMFMVNAVFDAHKKEVQCELYNIGSADVYIVDTLGNIIDEKHIDTDVPTFVYLSSAFCHEGFYIVIDSECVYAEGFVNP